MLVPSIFTNSLFDDFFDFPYVDDKKAERKLYGHNAANLMKTDIQEYDDGYQLEIDLPGFKKDEVHAELKDGYLVVSAEKGLDEDEQDKKTGKYLRRERYAGSCQRSFYVGEGVKQEDLKAAFNNGILTVAVPKEVQKPVEEKQYITIEQ